MNNLLDYDTPGNPFFKHLLSSLNHLKMLVLPCKSLTESIQLASGVLLWCVRRKIKPRHNWLWCSAHTFGEAILLLL